MNDWRGTPIVKGSLIVYPGRQSSSMWMMEAEVLEVITMQHWNIEIPALLVQPLRRGGYANRVNKKPVKITAIERVTVIPKCEVTTIEDVMSNEQIVAALIH